MKLLSLVSPLIYLILLAGIILIFYDSFDLYFRRIRRMNLLKEKEKQSYSGRLMAYMEDLLNTVLPESRLTPNGLAGISSCIFGAVLMLVFPVLSVFSAVPALFFASVPVLILRFRLEKIRNRGSREADVLVSSLLNCYRLSHKNIFSALESFISLEAEGCEITRNLVFQLLISIRSTKNEETVKKAVDRFAFALKTNWGYMLSSCIFAAAHEGIDITESLEDIIEQLQAARTLNEEKKRSNTESVKMVQILVPVTYFGTLILGKKFLDIPFITMVRNQFTDPAGIAFFIFIAGFFILNILLISLIRNSKFDF